MARGIGGDDGPTLWMFIACILIWGKVKGWFDSASDKLSGNLANPFQPETTADIKRKEAQVSGVFFRSSKFPPGRTLSFYQDVAAEQFKELTSSFNIDEDRLITMLKGFNVDELKAVYKSFGVKDATVLGVVAGWTADLFGWYEHLLTDSTFGGNDLTTMRKIWQPTGLWVSI